MDVFGRLVKPHAEGRFFIREWKNEDGDFEWIVAPYRPRTDLGAFLRRRTEMIRQMREYLRELELSHYWELNQYRLHMASKTGMRC